MLRECEMLPSRMYAQRHKRTLWYNAIFQKQSALTVGTGAPMTWSWVTRVNNSQSKHTLNASRFKIYNDCGFQSPVKPDGPAPCIWSNLSRFQRSHIARLRTGTLPIATERGRYIHIPANERLGKYCTAEEPEDEFLLFFMCSLYQQLRKLINLENAHNGSDHLRSLLSNKHRCSWLSGVAVACQRCRVSDRGSFPGFASGR